MSIKRIGILLFKEFTYRTNNLFLIFAIVIPFVFTLFVNLIFGSIFSQKPTLGIYDEGSSQLVKLLKDMESIELVKYRSSEELKEAVETGSEEAGLILPENFDNSLKKGELDKLNIYYWGESLLQNRTLISSVIVHNIRKISGRKSPIQVEALSLGDEENIPWEERLVPLIVLMAVVLGGFLIPSSSLVNEKQKRTVGAVLTTPTTQLELFIAKGLMGIILSMVMGILILILNGLFSSQQVGLIILLLVGGSIMSVCIGLIIAAFIKDIATLFSAIKGLGIILYAPALIYIFPQIPNWVGRLFPTYYMIAPLMEITQRGGNWTSISTEVFILIGIIIVLSFVTGMVATKTKQMEV